MRRSITQINYIVFENIDSYLLSTEYNYGKNELRTSNSITVYESDFFLDNLLNFNQNFDECKFVYDENNGYDLINTTEYFFNNFFNLTSNEFLLNMETTTTVDIIDGSNIKIQNLILS